MEGGRRERGGGLPGRPAAIQPNIGGGGGWGVAIGKWYSVDA